MEVRDVFAEMAMRRLKELGWTQVQLAQELGLNQSGINKVFKQGRSPRSDTVIRWARALKTTPNYLLNYPEHEAKPGLPKPATIRATSEDMAIAVLKGTGMQGKRLDALSLILLAEDKDVLALSGILQKMYSNRAKGKSDGELEKRKA